MSSPSSLKNQDIQSNQMQQKNTMEKVSFMDI